MLISRIERLILHESCQKFDRSKINEKLQENESDLLWMGNQELDYSV